MMGSSELWRLPEMVEVMGSSNDEDIRHMLRGDKNPSMNAALSPLDVYGLIVIIC